MADLTTLNASVADFRETISESMADFVSLTKNRLEWFTSEVDDNRRTELDYIDAIVTSLVSELDDYLSQSEDNKGSLRFPLETDSFNEVIDLSTLTKYTPLYKDITNTTNDIVNTLLPVINLPADSVGIKDLIKGQAYTTKYLACFDNIINKCINLGSDIGSPSTLFSSILYFENERNLYLSGLAMLEQDIKVSSKGFRKPNSINVFGRTELVEKFNRNLLAKYKEALNVVNNQLATLYAKAINLLVGKESFSISMSGKLLDSLVDASNLNTEFAVEEVKIAFLEYSSNADAAIKKLNAELTNIKTKEEAFIKAAQLLFEVQSERALRGFDAVRKKVEADIALALKDAEIGAEEIKLRVEGGLKELDFLARRLDYWANVMAQQAQDKSNSIEQANKVYQQTLSTLGSSVIALNTTKG